MDKPILSDNGSNANASVYGPAQPRKAVILCFDGTGNKFGGNSSDSNIIKIFSLLDRQSPHTHSYYQPGIGTYIEDSALSKTSRLAKIRSAYMKAKDSAVGTSFDEHVMAGYEFIMKYYGTNDDIYMFGFSRGAYIARFLAQMLDAIGLLSRGNEEMMRFAWKAFSQWQTRLDETEEQKKKKAETFKFMQAFRETFSRPVRRVRYMGLFDTVNSVPRFETAWMSRSRFPYTARSSAKVVRHAVAIDERRAKFRQNLISQKAGQEGPHHHHHHHHHVHSEHGKREGYGDDLGAQNGHAQAQQPRTMDNGRYKARRDALTVPSNLISRNASTTSIDSNTMAQTKVAGPTIDDDDEDTPQDVQEIWYPGCHADIGGGWPLDPGSDAGLSHAPLLWIVREAVKAGIPFDRDALTDSGYLLDEAFDEPTSSAVPQIQLDDAPLATTSGDPLARAQAFDLLHTASTRGTIHDSLAFGRGTPFFGVVTWNFMEFLPFRRMDLRPDGTWAPIRWPLPCGETRDIPDEAWIHHTALKRMEADKGYRPGNLIIGGGGRGTKTAREHDGTGEWKILQEKGSAVGEVVVRVEKGGKKTPRGANTSSSL